VSEVDRLSAQSAIAPEVDQSPETGATATPLVDFLLLSSRVQSRVATILEAEGRDFDLTATESMALLWLSRGSSPVSGIAKAVGLRPNGASVLVDRLRARGLVRRQRSRRDQRVVTVSLTDAGRSQASTLSARLKDGLRFLVSPLSPTEREWLVSMMERLASR
jgi:DNA-binding MarR family transcriptional regulator